MKPRAAVVVTALVAALAASCAATTRYRVLSFFFDGVPPLPLAKAPAVAASQPATAPVQASVTFVHGPYAAKLCNACHESGGANGLVAPKDQLCARCHQIELRRRFIHGPLAAGGCLVCHDPHSSSFGHLLVASPEGFCLRCHDRRALVDNPGHRGEAGSCTTCHDAHMSDRRFLLR